MNWVGSLTCAQRCCGHTSQNGVVIFVSAINKDEAEREIRACISEPASAGVGIAGAQSL